MSSESWKGQRTERQPLGAEVKLIVQLPKDLRDKVCDLALARGITPSEMVGQILRRAMGVGDDE